MGLYTIDIWIWWWNFRISFQPSWRKCIDPDFYQFSGLGNKLIIEFKWNLCDLLSNLSKIWSFNYFLPFYECVDSWRNKFSLEEERKKKMEGEGVPQLKCCSPSHSLSFDHLTLQGKAKITLTILECWIDGERDL